MTQHRWLPADQLPLHEWGEQRSCERTKEMMLACSERRGPTRHRPIAAMFTLEVWSNFKNGWFRTSQCGLERREAAS